MAFEAVRIAVALHDAGLPAVRRLPRQRRRAVADSRTSAELPQASTVQAPDRAPTATATATARTFLPYKRDERLVRPWAIPGTPGLEHRIGGIEKEDVTGNVNYDPANHEHMVDTRAQKIANIANEIPAAGRSIGPAEGDLLVLGWGGTYGAIADGRAAGPAQGPEGRPRPPALPQPDAEEHRRRAEALQEGAGAGTERRAAAAAAPRQVPGRRRRA